MWTIEFFGIYFWKGNNKEDFSAKHLLNFWKPVIFKWFLFEHINLKGAIMYRK